MVFTASHFAYADVVINTLEQEFRKMDYLTSDEKELLSQPGGPQKL